MRDISKIDSNFKSDSNLISDDIRFYNVKENPWCVFGLIDDGVFRRMPKEIAYAVNEGVYALHTNTSGGRIRFSTNSKSVAIRAVMPDKIAVSHMAYTGLSGFDMYVDDVYVRTFIPPVELQGGFEEIHNFPDEIERQITINFPLYNNVSDLYIGVESGCSFKEHTPYKKCGKIVYYGSSITQGGCVSRPGIAYPAQVSVALDCDFINLGFSGNARGEAVMAEYIAELNPEIFVMDYDHNTPTPEYLEETHEVFFKTFRNLRPNTPVVIMSAPDIYFHGEEWFKRRAAVYKTYKNALKAGDLNVYFVDGKELWGDDWSICSVDGIHPNDIGHYRMAQKVISEIEKIWRDRN